MSDEIRDKLVIERMLRYCTEVREFIEEYGNSEDAFMSDRAYRYSCAMCVMQIGELSTKLSTETKNLISTINWQSIRGMRNFLAHDYVNTDWSIIWQTITQDIPILQIACQNYANAL